MAKHDVSEEPAAKICGACAQDFPKDNFSKKQWQQKQQRRCKSCVDSNQKIDVANLNIAAGIAQKAVSIKKCDQTSASSDTKNKKGKKDKPVFAGNQDGIYTPSNAAKLASDNCAWCGRAEENETFMRCGACQNVIYCSRKCQKLAYPEHKLVCEQMKKDRKDSKKSRQAKKEGHFTLSEASGVGSVFLDYHPGPGGISSIIHRGELRGAEEPGQYFATDASREAMKKLFGPQKFHIFCKHMRDACLKDRGTFNRTEMFTDVDELYPIEQFLLSCGPLNDIERAKTTLPYVLHQIRISGLKPDGSIPNIGDITVRGYNLNALEWAARRGNYSIAEWLATDSCTKVMLNHSDSAPVAWACYTNKIELAKMLVKLGADSHATAQKVFDYKLPSHLAAENGQIQALRYLIEECGHDINECDTIGQDIRASLRRNNKVWASVAGCVAVDDYAKSKGVDGEMIRTSKRKTKGTKIKAPQSIDDKLASALKKLEIAGGKEESDDEEESNVNPGEYLHELLAVADARFELGQYVNAAGVYYRAYYAAMHNATHINNPTIYPIAHKLIQAWIKTDDESLLKHAHGMAQQNCMMPGYPRYFQDDLREVEKVMTKRGIQIQRFGMVMDGFGC